MKPFLLFLFMSCTTFGLAQETGKPVDFDNPRVGDYLALEPILFSYDGMLRLRQDSYRILEDALEVLKQLPDWKFQLESHTDCRTNHAFNDSLSQMRADTLLKYVLAMGFPAWRITAKGMGERMLLMEKCSCDLTDYNSRICEEKEHQLNRRTIIRLTEKIEWTGHEALSLTFPSAGQFRAIPFENSGNEVYHTANGALWYFLDSLYQCEGVHYTLFHLPKKRTFTEPFGYQKRKNKVTNLREVVNIPSRMQVIHKRPGQGMHGLQSGYVVRIDSLVPVKKILEEVGISGDTLVTISDVRYDFQKLVSWEATSPGGLNFPIENGSINAKYCLYIVTTNYPECLIYYDPWDYKKWIACQDTSGGDYIGYSARMREEFPNFPEIVEVRYINVPDLKRPWMLILQPIKEEE